MRKTIFFIAILVLGMATVACAAPEPETVVETVTVIETVVVKEPAETECATAKDEYTIGFANLTEDIVFTQLVQQGMDEAAAEAGNVTLINADNRLDGAVALENAENFIAQGVDGVVEFQTDGAFGNVIMSRFRDNGIPVIAIDIPMPGATFFGADNYLAGQLAGQALADWANANWDGKVDYALMLELPQSGPVPEARMQGMLDSLQAGLETPVAEENVIRLDSQNTQEVSFQVTSDTLPSIPEDANVVAMTINDGTALGTIAAFEAAGREEQLMVVGQNADPSGQEEMIKENSKYLGATGYFPENYGHSIIPAIVDILECQPVEPSIYVEHSFISGENVCDFYPDNWPDYCN